MQTKADELFRNKQYVEATSLYLRLLSLQPKSFDYNYKYGTCLLFNSNSKQDAIRYLNYAVKSPDPIPGSSFFLGKAFHLNYQFNDAISQYRDYLKKSGDKSEFSAEAQRNIVMCENGKSLLATLTDVVVRKKTEITQSDFFRLYDLTSIGGSIIIAVDFQSKNDKKYKHSPVVHISPNMENVYFSSYGEGDNLDIYVARKLPGGKFGVPQKVAGINTPFDENFPYMHPNGKELYFSSKGHNSMGGYDIFKAIFDADKNVFTDVANVDFSISSPDDDLLYIVDKDYKNAYFSSTRQSQDGKVVVYQVAVERIPIQLAIVKGAFSSSVLPNNPKMTVEVVDKASGKRIGQFNTLKENSYLITFPKGGKYEYRISIAGSNETFKVDVDVPFLKELRPLKQTMIHEVAESKEQVRIINQFDEQFEDAQSIVAQVLKERANLNVNSDQYSQEELEGSQKVKAIVAELKLENKSLTEIGQLLSRKADEINQQQTAQQQLQQTSNGLVSSLYQDINAIDAEIKNLVKEADLSESVRRKELVLTNAKGLYEQRDSKQQQIQQIQSETKTITVTSSGQPAASSGQITEISKQFNTLLSEGNEAKIATLLEQNKSYLKEVINQNALSESEKLLQQQNAIDSEIKRLQEIESTHVAEINRLENEIKDLTAQKAVAKEKSQQEFQDKIDAKNNQLEDNRVSLERTRVRIEHEHAKRAEINRRMNIVHEIENFKGKQASNEELEKVKASVREDNSRTLKAYIENTLSSISGQQHTVQQELKTIEQYNTESEAIYANQEWNDYEKSQRLVDLNETKQKEINTVIKELSTSASVNDPEKSKQLANAQKLLEQLKEDQEQLNKQLATATQKEIAQLSTENIIQQLDPEYNSSIQSINTNGQLSSIEKLEQLNDRNNILIGKLQSEVSQLANTTSTPLVAAKKELLNQHIQHLQADNQKRATEIQRLNQQKAEELAQQQSQQTTQSTKTVEEHTAELQQQYTGNLKADFSENPTTQEAVQSAIQRLSNYENSLKQQLTAASKITHETEKQQRTKAIEQELSRVENRVEELKQQQIALQQKVEELAQQQSQQTTQQTKTLEEHTAELQQQYTGNLKADFSENPTTQEAVQSAIQRLNNYENSLKQQRTAASKITNEAEKQQRIKAIDQELNRVENRVEELKQQQLALQQKAEELAQQQAQQTTQPTKTVEEHTTELQQQYTGNLKADLSETPTTENAIQGVIQRLSNYENNLKQQRTAASKITNETEKQQRVKVIDQELNRVENRIEELKQQQVTLQQKAEELAQQQSQQTTQPTKTVEEHTTELQQQYTGNLKADFSESPTTQEAVQSAIQRLSNYENNLKQQRTAVANSTNEAEKQQRTKAIEQELNRVENRVEELQQQQVALQQKAEELAQQQSQQTPQVNATEPSREENIQQQLMQDGISKTERKELTQELNQIKQESATKNISQLNETNTSLTQQIETLENRLSVNSSETKAIQANHDQRTAQLQKDIAQEKNVFQKERLTQQLVRENESYTEQLERIQQLYENDSIVSEERKTRVYSQNELQTRRKRALIEIEELSHLYDEIEKFAAVASKKEQAPLLKELDAVKAKKNVVEEELTFIEQQLELYVPVEKPLPLTQNNVAITYNEERAIAVTEQYEKYAQVIIQQNQLINQHQAAEKVLLEQQQTLNELRNQEATSDLNTLSQIQKQKQEVITQIEKSSLYLGELEKEISTISEKAITHLPTDAIEVMKFKNLVARGINPIKKTVIATALIPISASGIEYNPAAVKTPELKSIPVNLTAPKGLVYRVQVGAFAKPIPEDHFKEFTPVSGEKLENSNITRYMAGYFNNANSVVEAREKIRQFGYNDAFVVAYCDGKRIQFAEARRMEAAGECKPSNSSELQLEVATSIVQKLGLEDTTKTLKRVPEYSYNQAEGAAKATAIEQLPGDQIYFTVQVGVYNKPVSKEKLHNLTPLYTLRLENGQIRYSVGIFGDLAPARTLETLIRQEGISDAFIVAYYQGNRITVERARKLISEGVRVYSEQNNPIKSVTEDSKIPVPTTTEVNVFTESTSIKQKPAGEQFVQFVSKETYDTYPREELNRFNTKGVFHYDKIDKHIKSIYYPKETVLPRISSFSSQMDTLVFSNFEATSLNHSTISIELNLDAIPGDFNDWLIKYPYRKAYSFSENGLEIHIFDVRLEDVQEMKIMTELFGFPIRESLKEESK